MSNINEAATPWTEAPLPLGTRMHDTSLVEVWGALMFRWAQVARARDRTVSVSRGIDVRPVDDPRNVAEYVTDSGSWSVGAEVAAGPAKMGRSAGRWSPFALLAAAACWGGTPTSADSGPSTSMPPLGSVQSWRVVG